MSQPPMRSPPPSATCCESSVAKRSRTIGRALPSKGQPIAPHHHTKARMQTMPFDQKQRSEILSAIKKRILKHHVGAAGVNYEDWSRLFDQRVPELLNADSDGFEVGVQQILVELRSSHTVFYHESTIQVLPQHSINATVRRFEPRDGDVEWFFLDVFEDGPAHVAGIRPGDLLLAVDGTPYVPP